MDSHYSLRRRNLQVVSPQVLLNKSPQHSRMNLIQRDRRQIQKLQQQNATLKKQIVQLKVSKFFSFDQTRIKQLIQEYQYLQEQLKRIRLQLQESKKTIKSLEAQNDFLQRSNEQYKSEFKNIVLQKPLSFNCLKEQNNNCRNYTQTSHYSAKDSKVNETATVKNISLSKLSSNLKAIHEGLKQQTSVYLGNLEDKSINVSRSNKSRLFMKSARHSEEFDFQNTNESKRETSKKKKTHKHKY